MEFVKKIRPFDYLIIAILIVALIVGYLTFTKKRTTSSNQIEASVNIELEIYLRGVASTSNEPLFVKDDETFITIRNVPYTKLKVVNVVGQPRMAVFPAKNEKGYTFAEDVSMPNLFDFLVTLEDNAKKTPDGYVAGGNKIKMGIPVVIEGETYKYSGTISNVYEVVEEKEVQEVQ